MRKLHSFEARIWRRQTVSVVARFTVSPGANNAFREIGVRRPDGATQILKNLTADQNLEVVEP